MKSFRIAFVRIVSPWILSLLSPWSRLAAIGSMALALTACGDTINEQINANVGAVETSKDLPECTKDIAGQTAFVSETHEFLGCDGNEWQTLGASTVSVGDNVCMSKSLSDDSGFEIFCNGESIGTVRNGEKGADGKDGAPGANGTNGTNGKDGSGCEIRESTILTATVACGSETFTMDLTGYVEQSEECDAEKYEDCTGSLESVDLNGVSQKGPFVIGTDITAYELENGRSLKQTGKTFGGKIEKADGTFDIRTVKLKSTFAYIVADGFYRNEVTGRNSASTIKLRAFTNLQGRTSANINLVTHLEYDRVQYLVTRKDSSVAKAKMAAEREIFKAFYIDNSGFGGFAEDFNILQQGDGNAALLAISALLQGDRDESQLTALLASLSVDIGDNGQWDNELLRAQIADWAMKKDIEGGLAAIRANVEGWKLSDSKAPAFEGFVTNFWTKEFNVPDCTKDSSGRIFAVKNTNSSFYAANDSAYTEGDSSLVRLICAASGDSYAWRFASDIEKDTAALSTELSADTAVAGKVNTDFVYVKEGSWRRGTSLDSRLRVSCVADNRGITDSTVVIRDTTWYICDVNDDVLALATVPTVWRKATTAEADTAGFGVPTDDESVVRKGNVNKSRYYVYEDTSGKGNYVWRYGTELDYGLGACDRKKLNTLGKLKDVKGPNAWYICVDDEYELVEGFHVPTTWRKASDYEMDTFGWTDVVDEGSVRNGSVNGNLTYVFENGAWRHGTSADSVLGIACIPSHKDTLVQSSDNVWYKCKCDTTVSFEKSNWSSVWRKATDFELDMVYWESMKDTAIYYYTAGMLLDGPNTGIVMVWDADTLRQASEMEIGLGLACVSYRYGSVSHLSNGLEYNCSKFGWSKKGGFLDKRDYRIYKGVQIGSQTWMAENLKYVYLEKTADLDSSSFCYDNDPENCDKYGRLYLWSAAIDSTALVKEGLDCGFQKMCDLPTRVRGICPEGWHLPSKAEWDTLVAYLGGRSVAGEALKARSGWKNNGNGLDSYSFSALPAGCTHWYDDEIYYIFEGIYAYFWSSTEAYFDYAYDLAVYNDGDEVYQYNIDKDNRISVRCIKD